MVNVYVGTGVIGLVPKVSLLACDVDWMMYGDLLSLYLSQMTGCWGMRMQWEHTTLT